MVSDHNSSGDKSRHVLGRDDARGLVVKAMTAMGNKTSSLSGTARNPQMHAICDAFVDPDEQSRHQVIAALLSHGMPEETLIDHVIPSTAAIMGDRWFANQLSFAEVTIGAARLQETVRALRKRKPHPEIADGDRILLVVPRIEHHTLGAFVATQQFRRLGVDVQICVGMYPRQIVQEVIKHRFPMVGITAAGRRSLASARELVDIIRTSVPRVTPIVVGGSVTALDLDIKALTGCDYVCSDPKEVIRLCNLRASVHAESADA